VGADGRQVASGTSIDARCPAELGKRRSISRHIGHRRTRQRSQPEGPRPASRGSVARAASGPRDRAWPDRREGAAQILRICLCKRIRLSDGGRCRAQGSLRGRIARLSDGLRREDASHVTHAVRLGPATVATRSICPSSRQDAFRSRGSSAVAIAWFGSQAFQENSVPSRQIACRMTASLRATAIEARFQPMRLASRLAHSLSGQSRRTRVMSTPAAS
jgi:hypothetical protein